MEANRQKTIPFSLKAFCWLFVGIGVVAFCIGVNLAFQSFRCRNWPTTQGIIRTAEMARHRSNNGHTTYSGELSYDYIVAGSRYTGTRLAVGTMSASSRYARNVLARYPIGAKVTVHYSPINPQTAVLETGLHGGTWICFAVGSVFGLFGIAFLQLLKRQPVSNQTAPAEITSGRPINAFQILFGVIFVLFGVSAIVAAAADGKLIVGSVAGTIFCLAGLYIITYRPGQIRLSNFISVAISLLMLGIFNWLTFGSGQLDTDGFAAFVVGVLDLVTLAIAVGWLIKRLKRRSFGR